MKNEKENVMERKKGRKEGYMRRMLKNFEGDSTGEANFKRMSMIRSSGKASK